MNEVKWMRCLLWAEDHGRHFDRYMSQCSNKEAGPLGNTYMLRDLQNYALLRGSKHTPGLGVRDAEGGDPAAQTLPHTNQVSQQVSDNIHKLQQPPACLNLPTQKNTAAVSLASSRCRSKGLLWSMHYAEKGILGKKCQASASCLALCILMGILQLYSQ